MRVLAGGQVIKAGTDKVPNVPGYSVTRLFLSYILKSVAAGCVSGVKTGRVPELRENHEWSWAKTPFVIFRPMVIFTPSH